MQAKRKWQGKQINEARKILQEASLRLPNNENIFLAQAKLEKEEGNIEQARKILSSTREKYKTPKI